MRSKASFRGHPIHPALIPFPFAFLIGAFAFDVAGKVFDQPSLWTTGSHLAAAGVMMALVAAVPGFVDYLYTVPPRSTGKRRATRHMIVNLLAVTLVGVAWFVRRELLHEPNLLILALEAGALGLLIVGGWMGGTLVNRNQIGVDHRYANAGKWREQAIKPGPNTAVTVARADELKVDQMKLLHVGDRRLVLARTEKGYVAFDDHCPHRGGSLAGGTMICGTVQCPWHGSQFDVNTGAVKAGPANRSIGSYRVVQHEQSIQLLLPA
ncbi:MAG: Rieske 2Fe-2S domain-containing protein [Gemmatimonadota bacterium]|nr:Rieske 2Fe-2S domain-containing protein [Gemmatimonadota bacterium]